MRNYTVAPVALAAFDPAAGPLFVSLWVGPPDGADADHGFWRVHLFLSQSGQVSIDRGSSPDGTRAFTCRAGPGEFIAHVLRNSTIRVANMEDSGTNTVSAVAVPVSDAAPGEGVQVETYKHGAGASTTLRIPPQGALTCWVSSTVVDATWTVAAETGDVKLSCAVGPVASAGRPVELGPIAAGETLVATTAGAGQGRASYRVPLP